ncbi:MAG TPA: squalene--hopene cyclase [Anaeromyxobacter sp.]|nr:squalene--hopene cyclase [Anaeromyxobacter sp.]
MSGAEAIAGRPARRAGATGDPLLEAARAAAGAAQEHLYRIRRGEHWVAELESNVTITAEYVFLRQALGLDLAPRRDGIVRYLSAHQRSDGSWGIGHGLRGDVSTTAESYLALRLLGVPEDDPRLRRAEAFIRGEGGLAKVRVFTRIHLALFGLFPWDAVPAVPPEVIYLPAWSPVNIYRLASWARSTMVPLFLVFHHRPVFALPNGRSETNGWLDHLWLNPADKHVAYREPVWDTLRRHGAGWKALFNASDVLLRAHDRARGAAPLASLRKRAVAACERWVLDHEEASGDWGGIFPPMFNGVLSLRLQGYALDSDPVRRGLEAIERFSIDDAEGFRIEACQSPVWDTILALIGLVDAGADPKDEKLVAARRWVEAKQLTNPWGDWRVYAPDATPGGYSFEYSNSWYPDVDDTAAVVIGQLKQDPASRDGEPVRHAVEWMLGMQNRDGGWGAFDVNNDALFLNEIPFSDMDSLCDPSSPDVTGRVLEALGILGDRRHGAACRRALRYLRRSQEKEGSWFGRWGVNYVYGTSNVLNGLARQGIPADDPMVVRALRWLDEVQNEDGGFGEGLDSYADRARMGLGPSTASQTAWGVMGLLAYRGPDDEAVRRGIAWLVEHQVVDGGAGTWREEAFTGTGFPRHFYLRYHLYRHYFPLMALGRFCEQAGRG